VKVSVLVGGMGVSVKLMGDSAAPLHATMISPNKINNSGLTLGLTSIRFPLKYPHGKRFPIRKCTAISPKCAIGFELLLEILYQ
jgi:hypothetical protein